MAWAVAVAPEEVAAKSGETALDSYAKIPTTGMATSRPLRLEASSSNGAVQ